jgi:hypothetical protein
MAAASCSEGARAATTFTDLPRQQQREMMRLALVATVSTAYFITLAVLARPLPSRNLVSTAELPDPAAPRTVLLEADSAPVVTLTRRPVRTRTSRPRASVVLAAYEEPIAGNEARPAAPLRAQRRGNVFSRFLRTVFRGQPPAFNVEPAG